MIRSKRYKKLALSINRFRLDNLAGFHKTRNPLLPSLKINEYLFHPILRDIPKHSTITQLQMPFVMDSFITLPCTCLIRFSLFVVAIRLIYHHFLFHILFPVHIY